METVTSTWPTSQVVVGPSEGVEVKDFEEGKALCQCHLLCLGCLYVGLWRQGAGMEKPLILFLVDSPSHPHSGSFPSVCRRSRNLDPSLIDIHQIKEVYSYLGFLKVFLKLEIIEFC